MDAGTVLAEAMGWDRQDFKLYVRRLKELGLTFSLDVGCRLSPRGESYLNYLRTGERHEPADRQPAGASAAASRRPSVNTVAVDHRSAMAPGTADKQA
jgi:hypothetical protein